MMTDPGIKAAGLISVYANIAPKAFTEMIRFLADGKEDEAEKIRQALTPLFDLVTVKTRETTPYGDTVCRSRNPVPAKNLMSGVGNAVRFLPAAPWKNDEKRHDGYP